MTSGTSTPQARTASLPRSGDPAQGRYRADSFTLPGLGGSPLPQARAATNSTGPVAGINASNQPPIAEPRPASAAASSQRINNPYIAEQRSTAKPAAPVARSSPRQSPVQRPTPHVDPEALRRELAGSYPVKTDTSEPVARTAQATVTATADQVTTEPSPVTEPVATTTEPTLEEAAPAATVPDETPTDVVENFADAAPAIAPKTTSSRETSTSRSAADAFQPSNDFSAAFGSDFPNALGATSRQTATNRKHARKRRLANRNSQRATTRPSWPRTKRR